MDISTCLLIVTFNGNRQEQKTQGGRMDKKARSDYWLFTKDTETPKNVEDRKDIM